MNFKHDCLYINLKFKGIYSGGDYGFSGYADLKEWEEAKKHILSVLEELEEEFKAKLNDKKDI